MQVLELLRRECSGEDFDAMGLLQTLCLVKMDTVDGNKQGGAAGKQDAVRNSGSSPSAANSSSCPNSNPDPHSKRGTQMRGEHIKSHLI